MDSINVKTKWGMMTLTADERGLRRLDWGGTATTSAAPANRILLWAIEWLEAFQRGRPPPPGVPPLRLEVVGSDFQKRVWGQLAKLGFGETVTYKQLAGQLGSSPRAVGQAAKRNPLSLMIPCHRLVAVGGLGGYNGGRTVKEALLSHEASYR